jgi:hypothetical protein
VHKLNNGHCFMKLRLCVSRVTAEKPAMLNRLSLCRDGFVSHDLCQESNFSWEKEFLVQWTYQRACYFVTEELHLRCQQQCEKQPQTEGEDIKTSCLNCLHTPYDFNTGSPLLENISTRVRYHDKNECASHVLWDCEVLARVLSPGTPSIYQVTIKRLH